MPIGRGVMIFSRINIYETITTFSSITPPNTTVCQDTVIFQVDVDTVAPSAPTPTGGVTLIDKISGIPFIIGSLIGGHSVMPVPLNKGSYSFYAIYGGVPNQFGRSQTPFTPYAVTTLSTNTTIDQFSIGGCYATDIPFDASVAGGSLPMAGTVQFRLYSDNISFVDLPSADIIPTTVGASSFIPAFTMIPGNTYYLQARYQGDGCSSPSNSPGGTSGIIVTARGNETPNAAISGISANPFCIHQNFFVNAAVSVPFSATPTIGSITILAFQSPSTTINLGTANVSNLGVASIVVPPDTFTNQNVWHLQALYHGDGYCYHDAASPGGVSGFSVTPTEWNVTVTVSGPTHICYATQQTYCAHFSSTVAGTIKGLVGIYARIGVPNNLVGLGFVNGPHTGFNVCTPINGYQIPIGTNVAISAQFFSDLSGCYGDSTSSDYLITSSSSISQTPVASVSVSPTSGHPSTTFNFTLAVGFGSGQVGSFDGAGGLAGSATLFHSPPSGPTVTLSSNIHIIDFGPFGGLGSYSKSGLSVGTHHFHIQYNGNDCFGPDTSSSIAVVIT